MCFSRQILLIICAFLWSPSLKTASAEPQMVVVAVRAIHARNNSHDNSKGQSFVKTSISDSGFRDIKDKLRRLKYDSLSLISTQERNVALNDKDTVEIEGGHILTFRPVYKERKKVCIWLKWQDSTGMKVLDTRLHFDGDETVLTGMSNPDGSGIILAIDVR
jgi:hypothetical protein